MNYVLERGIRLLFSRPRMKSAVLLNSQHVLAWLSQRSRILSLKSTGVGSHSLLHHNGLLCSQRRRWMFRLPSKFRWQSELVAEDFHLRRHWAVSADGFVVKHEELVHPSADRIIPRATKKPLPVLRSCKRSPHVWNIVREITWDHFRHRQIRAYYI